MGRVFLAYRTPLTTVSLFRCLGQTLLSSDNNWPAVEQNLRRVQVKWRHLEKILGREGVDRRKVGRFYVVMVQVVLLFGSETWVLTPRLEKSLEGFHHRAVRRMASMGPKRQRGGTWLYTLIGAALTMVGLEEIGVYITCCQNTVAQYIANRPIMDLCLTAERKTVLHLSRQWWEQPTLDILGMRAGQAASEGGGRQGQKNRRERESRVG